MSIEIELVKPKELIFSRKFVDMIMSRHKILTGDKRKRLKDFIVNFVYGALCKNWTDYNLPNDKKFDTTWYCFPKKSFKLRDHGDPWGGSLKDTTINRIIFFDLQTKLCVCIFITLPDGYKHISNILKLEFEIAPETLEETWENLKEMTKHLK